MRMHRPTTVLAAALMAAALLPAAAVLPAAGATETVRQDRAVLAADLEQVALTARGRGTAAALEVAAGRGIAVRNGGLVEVQVMAESRSGDAAAAALAGAGGVVDAVYGPLAGGAIAPGDLDVLAAHPEVVGIRPETPFFSEAITGEGAAFIDADAWHAGGYDGSGITVAILDTGFGGYRSSQIAGDLPATVPKSDLPEPGAGLVVRDYCGGGIRDTRHGTAVAEIVHDIAPGADLLLICVDGTTDMASAIAFADAHGASVLQVSLGTFNTGRGDGTGATRVLTADARNRGLAWINSAGNYREKHWSGVGSDLDGDGYLELTDGSGHRAGESIGFSMPGPGPLAVYLKWDQWEATSSCDLDLELWSAGGASAAATSENDQRGGYPWPTEEIVGTGEGDWEIRVRIGGCPSVPRIDLFVPQGPSSLVGSVASGSLSGQAVSPDVYAVGAVYVGTGEVEPFSSQGPTIDGRAKPDAAAPDGVGSGSLSLPFFGSSAAAPHTSGAAALILQAFPAISVGQLLATLSYYVTDAGPPGHDDRYGIGILDLGVPPPSPADCFGEEVTIGGTPLDDTLIGTAGADVIAGRGGADTIDGLDGHDLLCGNEGSDALAGGLGRDMIDGGDGRDRLHGGDGHDTLIGGNGSDRLFGEDGKDALFGNGGDDVLKGGRHDDELWGGTGGDVLKGNQGSDEIYGQRGDDLAFGMRGEDLIDGGPGEEDWADGGKHDDLCAGVETAISCE